MISYGQNCEDVMLFRAFGVKSNGFYIDIGAMDPLEGSVTKAFYDSGWRGINVEPDPRFYTKLVAERPRDINLLLGVGEQKETRTAYLFEDHGISTLHPEFRDYFGERGRPWTEGKWEVTTLAAIVETHAAGVEIDFLKIDAEGWEGPILRGADWRHHRPVVLVIEATLPFSHTPAWEEWEPDLVNECGYRFVYFDGLNRFYLRNESSHLESAFAFPPNVLDGFTHWTTAAIQTELQQVKAELAQAREKLTEALEQSAWTTALLARVEEIERQIETRNSDLEARLLAVRSRLDARVSGLETQINAAVTALEQELDAKVSVLEAEIAGKRSLLTERLDRYASSASALGIQMEVQVSALNGQISGIQTQLLNHAGDLEAQVQELQQRLQESRLWVGQLSQVLASTRR